MGYAIFLIIALVFLGVDKALHHRPPTSPRRHHLTS